MRSCCMKNIPVGDSVMHRGSIFCVYATIGDGWPSPFRCCTPIKTPANVIHLFSFSSRLCFAWDVHWRPTVEDSCGHVGRPFITAWLSITSVVATFFFVQISHMLKSWQPDMPALTPLRQTEQPVLIRRAIRRQSITWWIKSPAHGDVAYTNPLEIATQIQFGWRWWIQRRPNWFKSERSSPFSLLYSTLLYSTLLYSTLPVFLRQRLMSCSDRRKASQSTNQGPLLGVSECWNIDVNACFSTPSGPIQTKSTPVMENASSTLCTPHNDLISFVSW